MREIKFRVWDKDTRRMYKNDSDLKISIENNGGYIFALCANVVIPPEYIELMQYTGLKDKYGKEIYESDIVIAYNEDCDTICKGEIVWDKWECGFSIKGAEPTFIGWYPELEVIGNIYENPELVK